MITGKLKSNHNRKKYYIQEYILFSEVNDIIAELDKYIDVYEMIFRDAEAERCYKDLKYKRIQYGKKQNKKNKNNNS